MLKQWVKSRTAKTTATRSELERYLRLEPQETEDPIEWWMAHQGQFPMASQLALGILAIPAMASNCERSFSLAQVNGDVAKGFRRRQRHWRSSYAWRIGDLADDRASRKLQDFYLYYDRWYGKNGNLPREKYIFPIDKEELARLDILHKFFFVVRKNNLFSASLDVEQPLRVLDLGTGTGIWAIELSEKYPHMHVQGLDFNMIQPKMIPRTMTPPKPFDLEGSWETVDVDWDFMHVRTLFGSIQNWPDLYKNMIVHLKPGYGYMEQVEIDWAPQCDDDSLPTDSALSQWASKLLDAMDQYGRPMRVNPEKTRQQLALAGFVDISETVIRACYNPWPEDATEKEAARWFNMGLSSGLTALSCAPMVRMLGMSKEEVEGLCDRVDKEICMRSYHAYCRIYIWTARKPGTASRSSSVLSS
ncbi:hypothetical protein FOVG_18151 [Fusarium oxysporum f. sp. pisi HDV247]|uniref:HAT C-terminal dimerisation domain-containing protein n=1 Tax=Fusarium oxysporum f. sp. pisi HDV247 TaxID=1080344 RepID=W9NRQ3_FUSOX|nr:hypothetical protein FOVG_18151 [Fusarium oxysporum f. sp. pisi HDV247]